MTTDTPSLLAINVNRSFNRTPSELRPIVIERGYTKYAPGSVLVCFGNTKVLVTATVEDRVPMHIKQLKQEHHGWITGEYAMLPGATQTRNNRERVKVSGRTHEIQRLIGRSIRACVDMTKMGAYTITLDADVLQADGGTRVAAITGSYVALVDALRHMKAAGQIPALDDTFNPAHLLSEENAYLEGLPIHSPVAAVSVGIVQGTPVLDLDYDEDSTAEVDANIVMNAQLEMIEFQATSEAKPFSKANLSIMLELAETGIQQLFTHQAKALTQKS